MMKTISTLLAGFLLAGLFYPAVAQDLPDDNLEWVGVDQALELALENDKFVLIDVYAEWCPYCQRMQSEIYPDKEIEEQIKKYFIPVRINTESESEVRYLGSRFTEAEFARALQFRSVPTTYFMNQNGEVLGQQPGFLPVDVFSSLLEFVGSGAFLELSFDEFEKQ